MALEIWLPTAINRFTSAGEKSRGERLPTTRPPITLSLDHRMTTCALTICSWRWTSLKTCGRGRPLLERKVACTAVMCCRSSGGSFVGGNCRSVQAEQLGQLAEGTVE